MSKISQNLFTCSVYDKIASDKLAVHVARSVLDRAMRAPSVTLKDYSGLYHELNAAYKTKLIDKHIADLSKKYARYVKEGLPVDGIEKQIHAIEKTKPATFVRRDVRDFLDKDLLPNALDTYKAKPWEPEIKTAVELWEKAKRIEPKYDRYGYQVGSTIPRVYFLNSTKYSLPGLRRKLPG